MFHIIANTVFLRLSDVASGLPPLRGADTPLLEDSEEDGTGYSQRTAYNTVFEELRKELAEALKSGSKRLLATYLQTLLAYPDGCTRGETVFDPGRATSSCRCRPCQRRKLYPKEKALIDLVAAEHMAGRRVAGLRHPHGDKGRDGADGRHPHPARLQGGGDEGRRGGS